MQYNETELLSTNLSSVRSMSVNNFFSINKMACLFDFVKGRLKIMVPRIESLISELLAFIDRYNASQAVNLSPDATIHNHVTKFILSTLHRDTNKLTHSCQGDSAVVLFNHSEVVLNKLANQLNKMVLVVHGALLERLKLGHLSPNAFFHERHQFKSQEFAHISR